MLDDIIKKLSDTYTSDLLSAEEEKEMVTTQLREERKFLKLILSEEGEAFNEFSPRSRKDGDGKIAETRKKIDELEKRQEDLSLSIDLCRQKLSDVKAAKEELTELRNQEKSASATAIDYAVPSATEKDDRPEASESINQDLLFRLKNIISFLPADPMRAKVELQTIVDSFSSGPASTEDNPSDVSDSQSLDTEQSE